MFDIYNSYFIITFFPRVPYPGIFNNWRIPVSESCTPVSLYPSLCFLGFGQSLLNIVLDSYYCASLLLESICNMEGYTTVTDIP